MRAFTVALTFFTLAFAAAAASAQDASTSEDANAKKTQVPAETAAEKAAAKAAAEAPKPTSLKNLLDLVEQGFTVEREENRDREAAFLSQKENQQQLLDEALAELARKEAISQKLEKRYNENEPAIAGAETRLTERLGELGELFGVVRQVATDLSGQTWDSITSSQLTGRKDLLDRLGRSKELPTTDDLEKLWYELNREIIEQGKIVRYDAEVLTLGGQKERAGGHPGRNVQRRSQRASTCCGKLRDQILRGDESPTSHQVPRHRARLRARDERLRRPRLSTLRAAHLLNALVETPGRVERVQQGGAIGMVIISLGIVGGHDHRCLALALDLDGEPQSERAAQTRSGQTRVIRWAGFSRSTKTIGSIDTEILELRLEEVGAARVLEPRAFHVAGEDRFRRLSRCLGLLGTVTGMIQTFQAITLFGAGDPKMMAGGISEALVTTMLGPDRRDPHGAPL